MNEQGTALDIDALLQLLKQAQSLLHEVCKMLRWQSKTAGDAYDWIWEAREDVDCAIIALKGDPE